MMRCIRLRRVTFGAPCGSGEARLAGLGLPRQHVLQRDGVRPRVAAPPETGVKRTQNKAAIWTKNTATTSKMSVLVSQ